MPENIPNGINFSAKLDISDAKKNVADLKKMLADLRISSAGIGGSVDVKGLTAYQQEQLKIKQQALDLAKIKQDAAQADREATLASKKAIDDERLAQLQLATQIKEGILARQQEAAAAREQAAAAKDLANHKVPSSTGFPNGSGIQEFANSTPIPGDSISANDALLRAFNADLEAGRITAAEYRAAIDQIAISQAAFAEKTVIVDAEILEETGYIEGLKLALKELNAQKIGAAESNLPVLNKEIQATEIALAQAGNIGKTGFDEVGNAVKKSTNYFSAAWSGLRKIAQVLPGIGIAGLIAFATGPLIEYLASLDLFKTKLTQLAENLKALNQVNIETSKQYGQQVSSLKILYDAATNVANSEQDRVNAAKELKKEYPNAFANSSTMAILNGKEKDSYDLLTGSILEQAKARAAASRIAEIESKKQDAAFQKSKIDAARANEIAKIPKDLADRYKRGEYISAPGTVQFAADIKAQTQAANDRASEAYKVQDESIKLLDGQESFLTKYAGGNKKIASVIENGNKLIQDPLKNFDSIIKNASQKADYENLEKSLQAKLDGLAPGNPQIKTLRDKIEQVKEIIKKAYDVKIPKNNDAESLKSKLALLRQISDATENIDRKSLTADQASLTAISDKFDQFRKKIAAFNADPKNKNNKIDKSVSLELNTKETVDLANQANINENSYIEADIEKKKKLYADYESYRLKVGDTIANADYADLLKSGKDMQSYLTNILSGLDSTDDTGALQQRKEFLQKELEANLELQRVALQKLTVEFQSYQQEREALIQSAQTKEQILISSGNKQAAEEVKKDLEEQLTALAEGKVSKLASYKELFNGIYDLSDAQAKKDVQSIQKYINDLKKEGKITKEAYDSISKNLNEKSLNVNNQTPEKLKEVGGLFQNIGSEVSGINEGLGKSLQTLGYFVSATGQIKENLNTLSKNSGATTAQQLTAGLGLIGTAVGVVTTIIGAFDNSKEAAEQAAYAANLQEKSIEAVNKALERQLELVKEIQGPERITAYKKQLDDITAAEVKAQALINTKISLTGNKVLDTDIQKRNDGQRGNPFLDSVIQQALQLGASVSLAGKSIDDLQKLLDNGGLDVNTAAAVQSLLDLKQQAIDTKNALNEEITGINFDSLNDSIKDVFASGEASAQKFADVIEKSIQGAFANAFERNEVEKALQPFYDQLTAAGTDGVFSQDEINQLKKSKDDISNALAIKAKAYQQILGPDNSSNGSSSPTTASGAIATSLTEDTGTRIYGVLAGTQLATVQIKDAIIPMNQTIGDLYQLAIQGFQSTLQIQANTKRTADTLDANLPQMNNALQSIMKSSGDSLGVALRAAGKLGY